MTQGYYGPNMKDKAKDYVLNCDKMSPRTQITWPFMQ